MSVRATAALTAAMACLACGSGATHEPGGGPSDAARDAHAGDSATTGEGAADGASGSDDAKASDGRAGLEGGSDAKGGSKAPETLCIGGQLYRLGDHDEFDEDTSLSVSDTWPPASGTEWSNRYQFGRTNNPKADDAYYPSAADLAAWGLEPVAQIVPGGLALDAYPVPTSIPAGEETTLCADGTCRGHLSGLLSNANAYTNGYWVYEAELPTGNGWWPAVWELNETTMGCYDELDNLEQWSPDVFGAGAIWQTEQPSNGACANGGALAQETVVPTSDSAFHTYGALATPDYVGFYIDSKATTKQLTRYAVTGLNPILQLQVCIADWCQPAAGPTDTARMLVKYYRYYAPPATPTSCPMPYDLPALPP